MAKKSVNAKKKDPMSKITLEIDYEIELLQSGLGERLENERIRTKRKCDELLQQKLAIQSGNRWRQISSSSDLVIGRTYMLRRTQWESPSKPRVVSSDPFFGTWTVVGWKDGFRFPSGTGLDIWTK